MNLAEILKRVKPVILGKIESREDKVEKLYLAISKSVKGVAGIRVMGTQGKKTHEILITLKTQDPGEISGLEKRLSAAEKWKNAGDRAYEHNDGYSVMITQPQMALVSYSQGKPFSKAEYKERIEDMLDKLTAVLEEYAPTEEPVEEKKSEEAPPYGIKAQPRRKTAIITAEKAYQSTEALAKAIESREEVYRKRIGVPINDYPAVVLINSGGVRIQFEGRVPSKLQENIQGSPFSVKYSGDAAVVKMAARFKDASAPKPAELLTALNATLKFIGGGYAAPNQEKPESQ